MPRWEAELAEGLPEWERGFVDEVIRDAEERLHNGETWAKRRALQLAREQAYHRLAVAIDRPRRPNRIPGQLSLFPTDPTLFDAS